MHALTRQGQPFLNNGAHYTCLMVCISHGDLSVVFSSLWVTQKTISTVGYSRYGWCYEATICHNKPIYATMEPLWATTGHYEWSKKALPRLIAPVTDSTMQPILWLVFAWYFIRGISISLAQQKIFDIYYAVMLAVCDFNQ